MLKRILTIAAVFLLIWWFYKSNNFWTIAWWISLFLFWMMFLWQGFKALTWGSFEKVLKKFTSNIYKSMSLWAFWAMIMQSSSLVTIIAISFLSADLIPLAQWIAISFWSNIWTTSWAWLMANLEWKAFWASALAMPIIVFWVLLLIQKSKNLKWVWNILLWIWIVFIWVWYIQEWFWELQNSIDLKQYVVSWFLWVLVFTWIWILMTILLQSSHATILLIMTALWWNQITYENALALAIWANIWTTFSWLLWALNSNTNWKRLAVSDLISKTLTWIIFICIFYQVIPIVENIAGFLWVSEKESFKLAIFHTFYNIIWVAIILPFYNKYINFIEKIVPERRAKNDLVIRNKFLNEATVEMPNTAIASLMKETKHMYYNSISIILTALWLNMSDLKSFSDKKITEEQLMERIVFYEWDLDKLYGEKIKILFWEIMDFSSNAQAISPYRYEDFSSIRKANIDIIEIVKTLKHTERNIQRFFNSWNEFISTEYKKIIIDIVKILSEIENFEQIEDNTKIIEKISSMEKYILENDIINNWKIDELIRNKQITNEMATSLLKDTNYKNTILKLLIQVAEILYNREIFIEKEKNKKFKIDKNEDLEKVIEKFKKKKDSLLKKLEKEKRKSKKSEIIWKIEEIDSIIEKYQS